MDKVQENDPEGAKEYFATLTRFAYPMHMRNNEGGKPFYPVAATTIRDAIEEAQKGPEMLMRFKEKKASKGTAVIYLRLLDNAHYLPVLSVKNTAGIEVLRENLPETLDLGSLGEIQISSKKVTVKPRNNSYTKAKALEPVSFEIML